MNLNVQAAISASVPNSHSSNCYTAVVTSPVFPEIGVGSGETHEEAFGFAMADFYDQNGLELENE